MLSKDGETTAVGLKAIYLFNVPSNPKPSHREASTQISPKLILVLSPRAKGLSHVA